MLKGPTTGRVVKPALWKLDIPDLEGDSQIISAYTWIDINHLNECVSFALLKIKPKWRPLPEYRSPAAIFSRYGHLNGIDSRVTWIACQADQTEITILGNPPPAAFCEEGHHKIYIPAHWGLNILKLAEQGGVVAVCKEGSDLLALRLGGAKQRLIVSGISPNWNFELE